MEETSLRFTSFLGGREKSSAQVAEQQFLSGAGAYCSLLEIGETRLLLDCGCLSSFDEGKIDQLRHEILDALNGRLIDAILISHAGILLKTFQDFTIAFVAFAAYATLFSLIVLCFNSIILDLAHVGALPYLCGKNGMHIILLSCYLKIHFAFSVVLCLS